MLKRVHFTEVVEILTISVVGIICVFYPISSFTLPAILALIFAAKCKHEFYDDSLANCRQKVNKL
jgi:chromate transport protein ChrA